MNEPVTGVKLFLTIVPDNMRDTLLTLAARWRLDKWSIGDVTNTIKAVVEEHAYPIGVMDVYEGISILLNNEVSARTVRYYANVAAFYSEDFRDRYDPLPFSHFEYAMGFDFWEDILNGSMALLDDNGGKPVSLTQVALKFQDRINGHVPLTSDPPEPPDSYDRMDGDYPDYDRAGETTGDYIGRISARVENTFSKFDEVLAELKTLNLPETYIEDIMTLTERYREDVRAIVQACLKDIAR